MNYSAELHYTYRNLRLLMGGTLVVFPFAIIIIGWYAYGDVWPTLSHYYFVEKDPGLLRTLFTSFLILVGGLLFAYRGFGLRDNIIYNLAGAMAVGVALFPKGWDCYNTYYFETKWSVLHGPCAIGLFVMAVAAIINFFLTKQYKAFSKKNKRLVKIICITSVAGMIPGVLAYLPYIARGILNGFETATHFPRATLIAEMAGFISFSIYWLGMTWVIRANNEAMAALIIKENEEQVKAKMRLNELRQKLKKNSGEPDKIAAVYLESAKTVVGVDDVDEATQSEVLGLEKMIKSSEEKIRNIEAGGGGSLTTAIYLIP